jgi:MFS family permease
MGLVVFYTVDTATTAWGPLYLASDTVFEDPAHSASLYALATLPYLVATLLARAAGDRATARFGPAAMVRAGALVGFAGLLVVVLATTWQVAVGGFFIVGLGMAVVAPLSFSAAARLADTGGDPPARQRRVDAVIARFNQFNYAGALIGSVLTGAIGAGNLRIGYAVPLVLVLALVPLARAFTGRVP